MYRNYHYKDKKFSPLSYLYNGNWYTVEMKSLYQNITPGAVYPNTIKSYIYVICYTLNIFIHFCRICWSFIVEKQMYLHSL